MSDAPIPVEAESAVGSPMTHIMRRSWRRRALHELGMREDKSRTISIISRVTNYVTKSLNHEFGKGSHPRLNKFRRMA